MLDVNSTRDREGVVQTGSAAGRGSSLLRSLQDTQGDVDLQVR